MRVLCTAHDADRFMQLKKIGVMVLTHVNNTEVYDISHGDLYECPRCGNQVITDFGTPFSLDKDEFRSMASRFPAYVQLLEKGK